ncbi:MAG: Flp family type IVb pilin [Gaiellaceae bacterium]
MPQQDRRTTYFTSERGQALPEYALLVSLIAVTVAIVLPLFGMSVNGLFSSFTAVLGG